MTRRTILRTGAFAAAAAALFSAAAAAAEPPPTQQLPTLWLVGDSTVRNGTAGQQGWGDPLIPLFDPAKVRVVNRAIGGRSSRSFQREGRWDAILREARPGDYVLIQMGHNDGGPLSGDNRERGSIRGTGDESREVTLSDGTREVVHTYGWYLRKYVADARAKGMTPILCSPVPRCPAPGKPVEPAGPPISYRAHVEEVARKEKVPYIDLYALIWEEYRKLPDGADVKKRYFCEADNTHTSPEGAALNARRVAEGLRRLEEVPALAGYLKPDAARPE